MDNAKLFDEKFSAYRFMTVEDLDKLHTLSFEEAYSLLATLKWYVDEFLYVVGGDDDDFVFGAPADKQEFRIDGYNWEEESFPSAHYSEFVTVESLQEYLASLDRDSIDMNSCLDE